MSLLFSLIFSAKLDYGALLNIGTHAATLPFLLSVVIEFIDIPIPWIIYSHLIYIIFLGIIIYKLRRAVF